jgi:hypothetical protein
MTEPGPSQSNRHSKNGKPPWWRKRWWNEVRLLFGVPSKRQRPEVERIEEDGYIPTKWRQFRYPPGGLNSPTPKKLGDCYPATEATTT